MNTDTAQWIEDINQPDYRDRLKAALSARKMSQAAFARACGCSPSNVSAYLNGYVVPIPKYMWQAAQTYLGM